RAREVHPGEYAEDIELRIQDHGPVAEALPDRGERPLHEEANRHAFTAPGRADEEEVVLRVLQGEVDPAEEESPRAPLPGGRKDDELACDTKAPPALPAGVLLVSGPFPREVLLEPRPGVLRPSSRHSEGPKRPACDDDRVRREEQAYPGVRGVERPEGPKERRGRGVAGKNACVAVDGKARRREC